MSEVQLHGFGWRHAGRRAWAVRDLDLHVRHGERVLLLGPSGAGKSTLLAALAGLLPSDSGQSEGSIEIDGLDPAKARDKVGIVFQDPQTQLVMARSGDDVAFGCENRGVPAAEIWPRVSDVLDRVGFRYPINRSTAALSGGEAQRLALAGVLALRPGLLLLDEPTANLDPPGAALIRESLTAATSPETTMIVVEHRVAEALPLVDRVVVLEPGGGVRADGAPEVIFAAYGDKLASDGVWVPGFSFPPLKATSQSTSDLVRADQASVRNRLRPVSIAARAGEVLAVTGPNGAGKSTLALLLGGLLAPTSGRIEAFGDKRPPHRWRAATLTQRIGSVFQNPEHQFVTGRVADELALGPRRVGRSPAEVREIVDELLQRLRLEKLAEANPYTLSGGEARRLSVATALATAPRLLVLDEPTFGQDRRTWQELVGLLGELRDAGHGVVAVTHDEVFVRTLADRTVPLGEPDPEPLPRRVRP
ncbi:putative ABC transporter ATP-binding protein [Actinoplanes missouriensis 431]|uniref:Putative ABC transporter ATP-binding protein n=1 Tax=Actinoplanes missouriensis (strain ATCC 14538 / DSM 43046 / CBS 188.64 / JCM 3121 / NBRC 102363 / NCIMB 12654 / NRRL B-3342 / UNCC 431) TaxID=512565 RepID=I0H080_ACTM4|nr:ABC transporter ATP-binding protein [Actinoplanes missouriensis]BAL86417.1 putative ABC transporter ATP-binding protein [Actinoplanes missouriensis 431]